MKKVALVFVLAVFVPSLGLAWLAVRSLKAQQIVFERQQTLLYQGICSGLVKDIYEWMGERQNEFGRQVEVLLADHDPGEVARSFDEQLLKAWPLAEVGFAVSMQGSVLSPPLWSRKEAKQFRMENDLFLSNQESVKVYWDSPKGEILLSKADDKLNSSGPRPDSKVPGNKNPEKSRAVAPQKDSAPDEKESSKVAAAEAEFRQLVGDGSKGVIGRFLQNRLKLLMWYRSPKDPQLIFGAQLHVAGLVAQLGKIIGVEGSLRDEICVALLDDNGWVIAQSHSQFRGDWKHPFVSVEIGDILPHWEVAVHLLDPARLSQAEQTFTLTLALLIAVLLLAIGTGGWLIVADLNRQLTLARQKTDFVSNVSHELKTPLTSIRMFSELLAEGRVTDEGKRHDYLQIITAEVGRLTRLINNVLDFARIDRGEKKYYFVECDLLALVRETVEAYRPQLESNGFRVGLQLPDQSLLVNGDRDALAQVLVNLLSNAEKYSTAEKEIDVVVQVSSITPGSIEVQVRDRGEGVPPGFEEKIFEQFFRAHDSLSSGIQGSGLGLTLARQIARAHGGDVMYAPRERGGSCFALRLPRTKA